MTSVAPTSGSFLHDLVAGRQQRQPQQRQQQRRPERMNSVSVTTGTTLPTRY